MNSLYSRWNVVLSVSVVGLLLGWAWLGWLNPTPRLDPKLDPRLEASNHSAQVRSAQLSEPVTMPVALKPIRVTTTADAGMGSLRWAIARANALPDEDLIEMSGVEGAIALRSPLPALTSNLTLAGSQAVQTVISGEDRFRVLQIDEGDITIRDVILANGLARGATGSNGGGGSAGMGGGLLINQGAVRLVRVQFLNNRAVGGEGSQRSSTRVDVREQAEQGARLKDAGLENAEFENAEFEINRGAVSGINGVSVSALPETGLPEVSITTGEREGPVNRGAVAGVNGVGVNGIGSIVFGGGGGFGGFANGGNGGN
ncbi:MAG: hypothetical protein WA984_11000, partial [Phormidesmis sp.]